MSNKNQMMMRLPQRNLCASHEETGVNEQGANTLFLAILPSDQPELSECLMPLLIN